MNFLPAIQRIASETQLFDSFDRSSYRDFADLNLQLLRAVDHFRPDVIFAVLMGYEVWTETLDILRNNSPAAILHWGTDDAWKYSQFSRFVAPHVDIHATTSAAALHEAAKAGLPNVVLSQWGASERLMTEPLKSEECDFDVTFVGAAYGDRRQWIDGLAKRGVKVTCFGYGWDAGVVSASDVRDIYRRSRISLNFARSSTQLRRLSLARGQQIKARLFEIPGAGGCLLTETAEDIDSYFKVGREIAIFDDVDGLANAIRHCLARPRERDAIARAGFERVRTEHTYEARFRELFKAAVDAAHARGVTEWSLRPTAQLHPFVARHRIGAGWRATKTILTGLAGLVFGRHRGARAARRATHEVYLRLYGARTYSSAGLPGRLFYLES